MWVLPSGRRGLCKTRTGRSRAGASAPAKPRGGWHSCAGTSGRSRPWPPVTSHHEPEIIEAVVDSGAEESVTPPGLFKEEVKPSPMSQAGRCYRAANGSPLPNHGQLLAHGRDADGLVCGLPFQVAAVERPLISVSRMAVAGCMASFMEGHGDIPHVLTGRRLPLTRRNGVYILELRVGAGGRGGPVRRQSATAPFPRPGQWETCSLLPGQWGRRNL